MTLETRLTALAQAVGADIKELQEEDDALILKAKPSANFTPANGYAPAPITFATEITDTEGVWNGTRFKPTIAGWYRIHAVTYVGGIPAGGYWNPYLVRNWPGGAYNGAGDILNLGGGNAVVAGGYVFGETDSLAYFNGTTDYAELYYWTSAAGMTGYAAYSYFEAHRVDHKGPKGDKGDPGSFIDAMTYFPSYDISEAVSGWGDQNTVGRPDNDDYLFTSVATDDQGQSPEGVQYVQTLIGLSEPKKVWRRLRIGSFTSNWYQLGNPAPTWTSFAGLYGNSWTEYDTARYSKTPDGFVQFRGEIRAYTGGATAADVFILGPMPVGFRPLSRTGCPVWVNNATALSLYVQADGVIRVSAAVSAGAVVNIGSVRYPTQ